MFGRDEEKSEVKEGVEKSKDQVCHLAYGRVYGKWNPNPSFIFVAFLVLEPKMCALNGLN